MFEEADSSPLWQRLETVLTTWIEMIERRKVAVVHKDLGIVTERTLGVYFDRQKPWGWAPWTKADLKDALEAWNDCISAINSRLPEPHAEPLSGASLFEVDCLRAAAIEEGGFAWVLYQGMQAQVPISRTRLTTCFQRTDTHKSFQTGLGKAEPSSRFVMEPRSIPTVYLAGRAACQILGGHT